MLVKNQVQLSQTTSLGREYFPSIFGVIPSTGLFFFSCQHFAVALAAI